MPMYHVIYGGRKHIQATSEEEAYREFWQWVTEQANAGNFGLIVEVEDIPEQANARGEV